MTRFAARPVLVVAALKCALNLAFADRYGWQRDELYYAVAGRHLQGGYVEFPPVTALLSAFAHLVFGYSLVGFRLSRSSRERRASSWRRSSHASSAASAGRR